MNNVLEYLERSYEKFPDKTAAIDEKTRCTYSELYFRARQIGTYFAGEVAPRNPIVVFAEKSVDVLQVFMGSVYAGCFYVLIDPSFPIQRIQQILGVLSPSIVVTTQEHKDKLDESGYAGRTIMMADIPSDLNEEILESIRKQSIDTDPLYGIFTSGSTGVPKGVVICHRSVIDFIDNFTEIFGITDKDVMGNQAPFDFDVSVKDIYSCLKTGATLVIIPKAYFMFPNNVVDMLDNNGVTTLVWAVSALCLLNRLHGLKYKVPSAINKIMFSGEMMPIKQLNAWRNYYPDAMFVNLYGPTEITCNCTYHIIDREYEPGENLPIGKPFPNEKVFLLDEEDREVTKPGEKGEICVSGTALSLGYYNNPEQTAKAFVQNPLNQSYLEPIYRTGDLAYYGEDGNLYFASRKDFQIKHMGHRIELGEIETALETVEGLGRSLCMYDEAKGKILAFYEGDLEKKQIVRAIGTRLPGFMIPNVFVKVEEFPLTKNGKIDRKKLEEAYESGNLTSLS